MIIENINVYELVPTQIIDLIKKLNLTLDIIKSRKQTIGLSVN